MTDQHKRFASRGIGLLAAFSLFLLISPGVAPLFAQSASAIQSGLQFVGKSKVDKTSGVWVDGEYVGYVEELGGPKQITLLPGEHDISVRQAGYQDFNQKVVMEPGATYAVHVKMQKAPGNIWPTNTAAELKVDIKPARAAVFVDDRFLGHAGELGGKFHSMTLNPGKHRIKVELPGYKTFEMEVNLIQGQKSVISTELAKGSINEADPLIKETLRSSKDN